MNIFIISAFLGFMQYANCALTVTKVVVRIPRPNDIGLIMDLTVCNEREEHSEIVDYSVRSDGNCVLDLGDNRKMKDARYVMGGFFGSVLVGSSDTVSLIWPTTSLFNRVGFCPIVVISTNKKGNRTLTKHIIHFDTRYETLDPKSINLRQSKDYRDCKNYDLDYFRNCTPLDCRQRYFGRRNFYNVTSKHCEPVPRCVGRMVYNKFDNECVDPDYVVTKKDIMKIKAGKYRDYDDYLREIRHIPVNNQKRETRKNKPKKKKKKEKREQFDNIKPEDDNLLPDYTADTTNQSMITGIMDGLMVVFATIGIYVLICFVIFLIVSCISRRQLNDASYDTSRTPVPINNSKCEGSLCGPPSRASLLSQR